MKNLTTIAALLLLAGVTAQAQTVILSDEFNANSGTTRGFVLGEGINFGINPPTTRLTGTAAAGLSYLYTQETVDKKAASAYRIASGRAQINGSSYSGRFSLSADGLTPFDFSGVLGSATATPANPVVYDVAIRMGNTLAGNQRFALGLGTVEGNVTLLDFGIQLYRAAAVDTVYQVARRLDTGSTGIGDVNAAYATTETFGTELDFRMRFTDAGAESGSDYNSRVQLFMVETATMVETEIYDTANDATLVNGWRFDGPGRFFVWDQAGATGVAGSVTYDNFSVTIVPEPSTLALGVLAGAMLIVRRRR